MRRRSSRPPLERRVALTGSVVSLDSHYNFAHSDEPILTAVLGVDNLVVVATLDAVLVTSRDKAEQVKELVEQLKAQNREQATTHCGFTGRGAITRASTSARAIRSSISS